MIRRLLARLRIRGGPKVIGTARWRALTAAEWVEEAAARRRRIEWLAEERRRHTAWIRRRHGERRWLS
jgi:hypothetical protein